MLVQNIKDKKFHKIPAHGGQGLIHMKFFHQEFQLFRETRGLPLSDPSYKKSLWNFIAYAELPEGSTVGRHKHKDNDEFYFILKGEAEIEVDGEIRLIKKGDIVLTRSGSYHAIAKVNKKLKFFALEVNQNGKGI